MERRVLVVDDEQDILFIVGMVLKRAGYQVQTATDGRVALGAVESFKPDLILLDMRMPGMDGGEFSRALRSEFGNSTPVIVMTGAPDPAEEARGIGAAGWLTKPFDLEDLLETVEWQLEGRTKSPRRLA